MTDVTLKSPSFPTSWLPRLSGDNLRKGAALNAVEIAEILAARRSTAQ